MPLFQRSSLSPSAGSQETKYMHGGMILCQADSNYLPNPTLFCPRCVFTHPNLRTANLTSHILVTRVERTMLLVFAEKCSSCFCWSVAFTVHTTIALCDIPLKWVNFWRKLFTLFPAPQLWLILNSNMLILTRLFFYIFVLVDAFILTSYYKHNAVHPVVFIFQVENC